MAYQFFGRSSSQHTALGYFAGVHIYALYLCSDKERVGCHCLLHFYAGNGKRRISSRLPLPSCWRSAKTQDVRDAAHTMVHPSLDNATLSSSEKGFQVSKQTSGPTTWQFDTLLSSGRPHEPSSRPSDRPSACHVEIGLGRSSDIREQKGPTRVDQRASKRGAPSELQCCYHKH